MTWSRQYLVALAAVSVLTLHVNTVHPGTSYKENTPSPTGLPGERDSLPADITPGTAEGHKNVDPEEDRAVDNGTRSPDNEIDEGSRVEVADQPLSSTEAAPVVTESLNRLSDSVVGPVTYEQMDMMKKTVTCDSEIFCKGPLLDEVQRRKLYPDSKTFVDLSLKDDPSEVLEDFKDMQKKGKITDDQLKEFMAKHFEGPGEETELWEPADWVQKPQLLNKIKDPTLKMWAQDLNGLWKILGRHIKDKVKDHLDRYTILSVPNGFIVPGDRFREFYYWDSYWILNGLLLSGMKNTSRGMLENFLYLVKRYGYVPNGGRIYYKGRSQPPLLISMVDSFYEATHDLDFIKQNLGLLEKEYQFWMTNRTVAIKKGDDTYSLALYNVELSRPRPEGYMEDLLLTQGLSAPEAKKKYSAIASAAESGWDFSSRWFDWVGPDKMNLKSIKADRIVPVDLNTFLFFSERLLAKFADLIGQHGKAEYYRSQAELRQKAIQAIFWDEEDGVWYDYDLSESLPRRKFFPSNIFPLMMEAGGNDSELADRVVTYLENEGVLKYPGGIPTSEIDTDQQWDFPHAWAPLVYFMATALGNSNSRRAQDLAFNISRTWVFSNLKAWQDKGHMYEKYSVEKFGTAGGGGEYSVQIGFGWSNGVILQLLDRYAEKLHTPTALRAQSLSRPRPRSSNDKIAFILVPMGIFIIAIVLFVCIMKHKARRQARRGPLSTSGMTAAHFHKIV